MRQRIYAMEQTFLEQLLEDRQELLAVARSLGSAEEMRAARAEFMEQTRVNVAPESGEQAEYHIDEAGTAHIPVVGELTPQARTDVCGAYTAEALTEYGYIREATLAANADSRVKQIRYNVDSPGGYYEGLAETADIIRASAKPTESRVGSMAASAAYWIASQTDRITAGSIGSRVGSIGVAVEEYDDTRRLENAGITRRTYTSTDAPDKRPDTSTEEGQAKVVSMLDDLHGVFTRYVAEGRGVSPETVNAEFGRGGLVMAETAAERGMIDGVQSIPPRETGAVASDATKTKAASGVAGEEKHSRQEAGNREVPMDRNQLKTEHPDLYAQLEREFTEAGVQAERTRSARLQAYSDADPQNAKLAEVVKTAIADGSALDDVRPQLEVALRDGAKLDGENPPDVGAQSAPSEDEDDQLAKTLAAQMFGGGK